MSGRSVRQAAGKATRLTLQPVLDVGLSGHALLNNARLNKGSAFPAHERKTFKLDGLLPPYVCSLDHQVQRAYRQFKSCPTKLAQNEFCQSLKLQNVVLYYALIQRYLGEMMSVIYTPTQGDAIENYSSLFRKPEGCFLDINSPNTIEDRLDRFGDSEDVDYIVVTDSEGILGIGDQGVGGIGICAAKLVLMTACGGIHPNRVIPVVLDTGTNNKKLIDDPLYMGNRHPRVRGERYDEFVDRFIQTVRKKYPYAVLHFEDFGAPNAARILKMYKDNIACFNDDIQGTGAVTLSALKGALHSKGQHLSDSTLLVFGGGSAGIGIASQFVDNLVHQGVNAEDARRKVMVMDRKGLVMQSMWDELSEGQQDFAVDDSKWDGIDTTDLVSVIKKAKPTALIGCSTKAGAFTEDVVRAMMEYDDRPIIFPLSNPTRLHEAKPADLIKWTDGKVLTATGSPFEPVNGREISENNNFLIFPGVGLGSTLSRASKISNRMISAAIDELASMAPVLKDPTAPLLPSVREIREVSARVATAVVLTALDEGLAKIENEYDAVTDIKIQVPREKETCLEWVKQQMWKPFYPRYRRAVGF